MFSRSVNTEGVYSFARKNITVLCSFAIKITNDSILKEKAHHVNIYSVCMCVNFIQNYIARKSFSSNFARSLNTRHVTHGL